MTRGLVEISRAGEKVSPPRYDVPLDGAALGQARDGLVHHRLVDAGGDVLGPGALVDEGLHVTLGEHAAAGGDGIRLFRLLGGGVHLVGGHLQQRRHLVDEGAGAAGRTISSAPPCRPDFGVTASSWFGRCRGSRQVAAEVANTSCTKGTSALRHAMPAEPGWRIPPFRRARTAPPPAAATPSDFSEYG